jgi:predicted alpha/beta hydrolase
MDSLRVSTDDGVSLSLRRFPSECPRRAVVVCGHAMMARGSYFETHFAPHLAREGLDCYVFDWRGHGKSVPPSPRDRPGWAFEHYVHRDLPALWDAVAEDAGTPAEEIAYVGHSLGGIVMLAALGAGSIPQPRKMSLWAVSLWLEGRSGSALRKLLSAAGRGVSELFGYAPIRRLSLGSDDEPMPYVRQFDQWCRSGHWCSLDGFNYESALETIETETMGFVGLGDRLCGPRDAGRFLDRLPRARPMREVGRARGDALDPDHFTLFTREEMRPVWNELIEFFAAG